MRKGKDIPKRQPNKPNKVLKVTEKTELMKFLIASLPDKNRNNIKTLLRDRHITVGGKAESQFNFPLEPGQTVEVRWSKVPEAKAYRGISIVFEDDDLIVIDKHSGTLSVATDKEKRDTAYSMLSTHVKMQNADNKIFVVHRLDKDTSGLMVYAKNMKTQKLLQENWNDAVKERAYLAVVEGSVVKEKDTIQSYLKETSALIVHSSQNPAHGVLSITHYEVIKRSKDCSLLKVNLETGRKNQVRVHMKDIKHPVTGDKKYGAKFDPIGRLGLHAWILTFTHPVTGKEMVFKTPVPRKFLRLF
ncbi:MAG: RluA family pseudouridine synthase [Flavobacteriales bacterium]